MVFENAYSFDQKNFKFDNHPTGSDRVILGLPRQLYPEPLTLALDPDNKHIGSFQLKSFAVMCREFGKKQSDFRQHGKAVNCTVLVECWEPGRDRHNSLPYTSANVSFGVDNRLQNLVAYQNMWYLSDIFKGLRRCTLNATSDEVGNLSVMIDRLSVEIEMCD